MNSEKVMPGTSGLAQNVSSRKSIMGKKLKVLKKVKAGTCQQNEY